LAQHDHGGHGGETAVAPEVSWPPTGVFVGEGRVLRVEPENSLIALDHGPIPALGWEAMVMGFRVDNPTLLDGLAVGDAVRFDFKFDADGNDLYVVDIEKTN
jgi:Cu(I)/Ag(I) efflux system protein CusF